jgi:hypothetical protein
MNTNVKTMDFNAQELCSRKLWQMVNTSNDRQVGEDELREAIAELASRRRYLAQLRESGILEAQKPGA